MTNSDLKSKLEKSIAFLEGELAQIRTSRATPSLLESISAEVYGTKMSLKELGSVTALDSQTLLVSPWDKSLINEIGKAIRESDLNVNPVVGADSVKVPIPPLTEERRKELVRVVSIKLEDVKKSMRNVRQEAMKDIEKSFSDKQIGEDEKFSQKDDVERILKEFMSQADELGKVKEEQLLQV